MAQNLKTFIYNNRHLIGFGFLLTFLSSFGQTFLISLYLPFIQETFELSDGGFSSIYALATISSAFTITWVGSFIDKIRLTKFTTVAMLGLIIALLLLSGAFFIPMLFIALYGLRLFGQGMMTHTSITSMARFFDDGKRGKAISFASLGHPMGEAILPVIIISLIGLIGWRLTVLSSAGIVAIALPFALYLLFYNTNFSQLKNYLPQLFSKEDEKQSKPWHILKTHPFWLLMPSSMASAAIGTGFLLFKLKLGLTKGWDPTFIAVGFTAYAVGNALSNLLAGFLADKFSGKVLFPIYLLPSSLGILTMAFFDQSWAYIVLIAGIGITNGFGGTIKNVALAEFYGVKIIGSVRSLFIMLMVFGTALGPLFFGIMLDAGYSFETIGIYSALVFGLCTLNASRVYLMK